MIVFSVLLLVVSQLIIKSRLNALGAIPLGDASLWKYFVTAAQDVRLVGGFAILALGALGWYAGLSRIPLSVAFPVGALAYPLVFIGAVVVLREDFTWHALAGNMLVVSGVLLVAYSHYQ